MDELLLTADFHVDGYVRRLEVFGDRMRGGLGQPLARIGGFARAQSKKRFDVGGPGWAPLAKATTAQKPSTVAIALFHRGRSSPLDEIARLGRRRSTQLGLAAGAGQRLTQALGIAGSLKTKKGVAVAARLATQSTRQRDQAIAKAAALGEDLHGLLEQYGNWRGVNATDVAGLIAVAEKEQRRRALHRTALAAARLLPAGSAERRRVARIGAPRLRSDLRTLEPLGSLRDALHLYVDGGNTVVVFAGPTWSGVHNKGGTAGHGAKIPAREFLLINSDTLTLAVQIFEDFMLEPFVSDAGA